MPKDPDRPNLEQASCRRCGFASRGPLSLIAHATESRFAVASDAGFVARNLIHVANICCCAMVLNGEKNGRSSAASPEGFAPAESGPHVVPSGVWSKPPDVPTPLPWHQTLAPGGCIDSRRTAPATIWWQFTSPISRIEQSLQGKKHITWFLYSCNETRPEATQSP